jgi:hypothetical protein
MVSIVISKNVGNAASQALGEGNVQELVGTVGVGFRT